MYMKSQPHEVCTCLSEKEKNIWSWISQLAETKCMVLGTVDKQNLLERRNVQYTEKIHIKMKNTIWHWEGDCSRISFKLNATLGLWEKDLTLITNVLAHRFNLCLLCAMESNLYTSLFGELIPLCTFEKNQPHIFYSGLDLCGLYSLIRK